MRSVLFCHCCHQTDEPMSEMAVDQLAAYQSLLNVPNQSIAKGQICVDCSGLLEESQRFSRGHPFNINVCTICRQSGTQLYDLLKLEDFHDPKLQAMFSQKFGFLSELGLKFCLECMMRFGRVHEFFQKCYLSHCHQSPPIVLIQDVKHEQEEIIEDVVFEDETINLVEIQKSKPKEPQTRYNCEKCSESFKYRKYYLEHMAKHQGEWKVHECKFCEETFSNQLDLDKHSSLHQLDKISRNCPRTSEEFTCQECGLCDFMYRFDVELHLYHEHRKMIGETKTSLTFLPYPDGVEERLKQIRVHEGAITHRYECLQCGAKLKDWTKLKQHLLSVHSKVRPFTCPHCMCSYKSKGSLTVHMKKHKNDEFPTVIAHEVFGSDERDFPCRYCPKKYTSARSRQQHEDHQHINRRYYLCKFCDKQFIQRRSVWEHAFTHRDFFAYNCLECDYQANQRANFVKHLRKVHNQQFNPAVHEYTKETFDQVVEFALLSRERVENIENVETKSKESPEFRCSKCVQIFATSDELLNHQSSHERHFECHYCSAIYYHRRFIETHLAKHMAKEDTEVKVEPQPKKKRRRTHKFTKSSPIQIEAPKSEAMFACPSCSKQYRSKIAANRHISQVHGTGGKFKCLVCSKFYPNPKSLIRHVETVHTSVKEFQCPDCLSTYKTQQSLTIHMRLHNTADNCFSCQQCPKTFQSETGLTKHIKISHEHDVEICTVCSKTFVTADGLFEHSFIHKGFDPFSCPKSDCPYTVKGKECFASHLIVHHGIVFDEKIYGYKVTDEERHREAYLTKVQLLKSRRKYECHYCENKRYRTKLSLSQHMTYKHMKKGNN